MQKEKNAQLLRVYWIAIVKISREAPLTEYAVGFAFGLCMEFRPNSHFANGNGTGGRQ